MLAGFEQIFTLTIIKEPLDLRSSRVSQGGRFPDRLAVL